MTKNYEMRDKRILWNGWHAFNHKRWGGGGVGKTNRSLNRQSSSSWSKSTHNALPIALAKGPPTLK